MVQALVPLKDLVGAKTRLAGLLGSAEVAGSQAVGVRGLPVHLLHQPLRDEIGHADA